MKKKVINKSLLTVAVIFILSFLLWRSISVNIGIVNKCEIINLYNNPTIKESLTESEIKLVCDIFEGKLMYVDTPSCGFSESVSICFNGKQTFCIACDGCPLVYFMEKDKYFRISNEDMQQIHNILEGYGFSFPIV